MRTKQSARDQILVSAHKQGWTRAVSVAVRTVLLVKGDRRITVRFSPAGRVVFADMVHPGLGIGSTIPTKDKLRRVLIELARVTPVTGEPAAPRVSETGRRNASNLARELEVALNETASRVLNARGAELGCPALVWFLPAVGRVWQREGLRGLSDVDLRGSAAENAARWADVFGLSRDSGAVPGTVGYVGRIDGVAVDVWVIVDDDVFNRGVAPSALG